MGRTSTSSPVIEMSQPLKTRMFLVVILLLVILVVAIVFIVLYAHEKNNDGDGEGKVCKEISCVISAGGRA